MSPFKQERHIQSKPERGVLLEVCSLTASAHGRPILKEISLSIHAQEVFGIIGPSGVGKTTLLRCLNRLVELDSAFSVSGAVWFQGRSIFAGDGDALRTRIGMIFQQPVVYPRSIYHNVIFGLRYVTNLTKRQYPERAEWALRQANLWDEVKGRLKEPAQKLSMGQQQRLCLARSLAVEPDVLLMDEPTSALDPEATQAIEGLIRRLKATCTVVLVTHDHAQAERLSDRIAVLVPEDNVGRLLRVGPSAGGIGNPYRDIPVTETEGD